MSSRACRAVAEGGLLRLMSPAFDIVLGLEGPLRAMRWENRLNGHVDTIDASAELRAIIDRAEQRLWIRGWRGATSVVGPCDPDEDPGLESGYADPWFDDRAWPGMHSPSHFWYEQDDRLRWARTHLFLPEDARDRPMTLVLGGVGLFDFGWMRVFVNGAPIGVREASGRWREPGRFDLGPGSAAAAHLRLGGDNVIALQLGGYIARDEHLDAVDPGRNRLMPLRSQWPAQFEQHVVVGEPDRSLDVRTIGIETISEGDRAEVRVAVASDDDLLHGKLVYAWAADEPVLRRSARLWPVEEAVRVMRLDLLRAESAWASVSDGEQGFPVYLDDAWFTGVEHPAGWAIGRPGSVALRQYPGAYLVPGDALDAMGVMLGAAGAEGPREAFLAHLRRRMRRVRRADVRPRLIATAFGSWDYDLASGSGAFRDVVSVEPTETIILEHLERVREGLADGLAVDTYVVDFWTDPAGDVALADRTRFPRGLRPVREAAEAAGAALGLWLDSSMAEWTIGQNPVVSGAFTHDPGYGTERASLCRAAEPYRTLFRNGLVRLVTEEGARLIKQDNLQSICHATDHGHLPGIWSTEAIMSAQLEGLRATDAANPETFLMLYWGHRSPWWLLDADTLFEPGFWIEAAHPAASPTLHVRDSVICGLDQAQRYCADVPAWGKDSLGVWLSDWKWNSSIGPERWAEAMVMDLCRGSLLVQPWSDRGWLDPADRRRLAGLVDLMRRWPAAFAQPRPIGGDPWRHEPYGYACSDGERAFVALFNVTWRDAAVPLELGEAWGLPEGRPWRVVRRFPDLVELTGDGPVRRGALVHLRPFQVVLLEVIPPDGRDPGLDAIPGRSWPRAFVQPSVGLDARLEADASLAVARLPVDEQLAPRDGDTVPVRGEQADLAKRGHRLQAIIPSAPSGATAALWVCVTRGGHPLSLDDAGSHFAATATLADTPVAIEPIVRDRTYSVPWQAWRLPIEPDESPRRVELLVTVAAPRDADLSSGGAFVPFDPPTVA